MLFRCAFPVAGIVGNLCRPIYCTVKSLPRAKCLADLPAIAPSCILARVAAQCRPHVSGGRRIVFPVPPNASASRISRSPPPRGWAFASCVDPEVSLSVDRNSWRNALGKIAGPFMRRRLKRRTAHSSIPLWILTIVHEPRKARGPRCRAPGNSFRRNLLRVRRWVPSHAFAQRGPLVVMIRIRALEQNNPTHPIPATMLGQIKNCFISPVARLRRGVRPFWSLFWSGGGTLLATP